jgi:glycosyl hydrolase family 123
MRERIQSPGSLAILILFQLLAVGPCCFSQTRGLNTWFVDSLIKVFPSDLSGTHALVMPEFWGARNQHVSVQLAIRSSKPLSLVTAEVSPLEASGGQKILAVTVQPVGYVVVGSHSSDTPQEELVGEAPGWYPDPLMDFPLELQAGRTYPLWVSVHIPSNATPGSYRGTIKVSTGGRQLARAEFRLKVVEASVPEERSLKVTNWFSLDDKLSRQFYGIQAFSSEWWSLVENVGRVLADHRQNVVLSPLMDLVQARSEGAEIRYEFANFDRWVETFQRAGTIGTIEGSHLLGRAGGYDGALQVETFQLVDRQVKRVNLPPDNPGVEKFMSSFLPVLNSHLEQKGWKPIYLQHILDEAHGNEPQFYAKMAALVRRHLPGIATIDAVDAAHMPEILQDNCDIWVPLLGRFDGQMEMLRRRTQSGRQVWFYTCLFPREKYLNRLMDFPLLKTQLLHWLNFKLGLTGFLHWGGNYWTPDPFKDTQPVINENTELLPPGDAFIVYPDRARKSVRSSIRLEAMREGIEDYELLRLLYARRPAEAERIAGTAVSSFTEYVRDPAAFRKIERSLLEALSKQ